MSIIVKDMVHYVVITVRTGPGGEFVEGKKWENMQFDQRMKWDWYFKYRAALFQVKHPRYEVSMHWGHEPAKDIQVKNLLKNKIRARKAKITEYKNKIADYKAKSNSLFDIKDDPAYQKATGKIRRMEIELAELQKKQEEEIHF